MYTKLLIIAVVGLFWSCSSLQKNNTLNDPTTIGPNELPGTRDTTDNLLNGIFEKLLSHSDTIVAIQLEEWTVDSSENAFYNYKILQEKHLTPEQVDSLKNIATDESNYILNSDITKRCDFYPNIGFYHKHLNDETVILIAFNCNVIRVINNGQDVLNTDCDPGYKKWIGLGDKIFPGVFKLPAN